MKSLASAKFWQSFNALPLVTQQLALKNFELWRQNPQHPSIHFKPVGKYWSVRIGAAYRALALKEGEDYIWFWIGRHDEYERIIK